MNQEYYDEEQDWKDNYYPLFDFRMSKWEFEQREES